MAIYIVLGAHRSGTSAIAGALHHAGINMGNDRSFRPRPNRENQRGFFENVDFRRLNDALLRRAGYHVKSWNPSGVTVRDAGACRAWMERLLGEYDSIYAEWGWKDPRQMLTLPAWHRELHTLGLESDVRYVFIYRNPLAVAHSLRRRGDVQSISHGVAIWQLYNETALEGLSLYSPKTIFTLSYEAFLRDPSGHLESLSHWSNRDMGLSSVHTFISEALQHSTALDVDHWPDPVVTQTYERLLAMDSTKNPGP